MPIATMNLARLSRDELMRAPLDALPWPLFVEEVAARLGCSVRRLLDILHTAPHYRKAGKRFIFTQADFLALLDSLRPAGQSPKAATENSAPPRMATTTPRRGRRKYLRRSSVK